MSRLLIGYDIHDNRRRRATLKALRALTPCFQESFFDCELDRHRAIELWLRLTANLHPEEDGLIFAWLDPSVQHALGQRWTLGGDSLLLVI
ncbi:CRISPR-associated protein, Cas2 family [Pseudomonas pohangensis]|uniref:CRISPR-associated endoribonuclease Cas2 n=1 Tax=Pseudomonas pohangensis TaxID=364197 RepID=A0A1H2G0Y4_9PSED|nr:CRISPR-associated endonuclease Cas2 [Pseudomonas pohangensis]SDU13225.1 CRISPR-associated protein, Cas2 family [Pseudomonas pohangensis]